MTKTMKRLLILVLLLLPLLTACGDIATTDNTTDSSSGTSVDNTDDTVDVASIADILSNESYDLTVSELEEYFANIDDVSAVYTAAIVMPSVVEVTYSVDYTYTSTYPTPGGTRTETYSDTLTSQATAFFINADGYLVTNAHVVSLEDYEAYDGFEVDSATLYFNFADSEEYFTATIIDYDTELDLALLLSDTTFEDQTYLTFFDISEDNELYYGESVLAVGNALGYGISVTEGIISAPIRYFDEGSYTTEAIQTDTAINEGNSGGPLVNLYGAVVGINSFKIVTDTSEGLGYAIPSNVILDYLDSLGISYSTTTSRAYSAS